MAKKQKVNKSQAVREYLKANPEATNTEVAHALTKKGITITANYVATLKSQAKRKRQARKAVAAMPEKPAAVTATAAIAPEAPAKPANGVTLEQIRAVGQMVKTIGGFRRVHEMLAVIKDVGGTKKFKDLVEAMSITETDKVPF